MCIRDRYLGKGMSCYVPRKTYSPKESIEMIKNAGGLAILAHPVYITEDYDKLYSLLKQLKEYGLDGTECLYNCYSEEFSKMCFDICDKLGLVTVSYTHLFNAFVERFRVDFYGINNFTAAVTDRIFTVCFQVFLYYKFCLIFGI